MRSLVFAVLIAITPYAVDITLQKRSTRKKEELYTEFLFKLSEPDAGRPRPHQIRQGFSKTDLGILTPHIRIAATSMTYGKSFEESMKAMAKSLHSEMIERYTCTRCPGLLLRGCCFGPDSQGFRGYEEYHCDRTGEGGQPFAICDDLLFRTGDHHIRYIHPFNKPSAVCRTARLFEYFGKGQYHSQPRLFPGFLPHDHYQRILRWPYHREDQRRRCTVRAQTRGRTDGSGYIACALFILPPPAAPPAQAFNITRYRASTTLE